MAFILSQHKDVIQKITLNIGNFLGSENAEDAKLTLREPNYLETIGLKKAASEGEEGLARYMSEVLSELLVEHNIYKTEEDLASNQEVCDLIFSKVELADYVASEYFKAVFTSRLSKNEEK